MKRMILPLGLGLVLGLGGSVGFSMWKGDDPSLLEAYANEVGSDSLAAHTETAVAADSLSEPGAAPDSSGIVTDSSSQHLAADTAAPASQPDSAAAPPTPAAAESSRIAPERLAKVFGTMQAREAARIMEHMEDGDVQSILGKLGDRQAAAILSNLSPQRAAVISRIVIRGERSSP